MRRRAEYLVEKRCGRREWLRATKLARSILLALSGAQHCVPERAALALRIASAVLANVRRQAAPPGPAPVAVLRAEMATRAQPVGVVTTHALAAAAAHELLVAGEPLAARRYVEVGIERRRRAAVLHDLRLTASTAPAAPTAAAGLPPRATGEPGRRW